MPTVERPRVLIADDYGPMVVALKGLLSLTCDVVGTAADVASVIDTTKRLKPDVVLLDLNLPGDSLDACREITRTTPQATVIVLTSGADSDLRPDVLAAGASAFLDKAEDVNTLLSIITGDHRRAR